MLIGDMKIVELGGEFVQEVARVEGIVFFIIYLFVPMLPDNPKEGSKHPFPLGEGLSKGDLVLPRGKRPIESS